MSFLEFQQHVSHNSWDFTMGSFERVFFNRKIIRLRETWAGESHMYICIYIYMYIYIYVYIICDILYVYIDVIYVY